MSKQITFKHSRPCMGSGMELENGDPESPYVRCGICGLTLRKRFAWGETYMFFVPKHKRPPSQKQLMELGYCRASYLEVSHDELKPERPWKARCPVCGKVVQIIYRNDEDRFYLFRLHKG